MVRIWHPTNYTLLYNSTLHSAVGLQVIWQWTTLVAVTKITSISKVVSTCVHMMHTQPQKHLFTYSIQLHYPTFSTLAPLLRKDILVCSPGQWLCGNAFYQHLSDIRVHCSTCVLVWSWEHLHLGCHFMNILLHGTAVICLCEGFCSNANFLRQYGSCKRITQYILVWHNIIATAAVLTWFAFLMHFGHVHASGQ